jgi:hypothetical protein
MSKSLAQGDVRKSLQMKGLAGLMALHGIAALGLDQSAWKGGDNVITVTTDTLHGGEHAARGVAGSGQLKGGEEKARGGGVNAAGMAVNVLRGVIRGCGMEVLQQLVAVGLQRNIPLQDQGRALVQAAHGDAELMEEVRQLLAVAGSSAEAGSGISGS